jgi:hypothetical protein
VDTMPLRSERRNRTVAKATRLPVSTFNVIAHRSTQIVNALRTSLADWNRFYGSMVPRDRSVGTGGPLSCPPVDNCPVVDLGLDTC